MTKNRESLSETGRVGRSAWVPEVLFLSSLELKSISLGRGGGGGGGGGGGSRIIGLS